MATTPKKKPPAKKAPVKKAAAKKPPVKKAPSGTLTERMGEVKNRPNKGLPARIKRPRGNLNRATTPNEIRLKGEGGTGRSLTRGNPPAKFKPVPLGERLKLLSGPFGKAAKSPLGGIIRGGAVVTALTSIVNPGFMSYKTGGQAGPDSASPPKYGRTLREQAEQRKKQAFGTGGGNPKTVNSYKTNKARIPARGEDRGGMKSTLEAYRASKAPAKTRSVTTPPYAGMNKSPVAKAPSKDKGNVETVKKKNLAANQKLGRDSKPVKSPVTAPKPKINKALPVKGKEMTFQTAVRRNMADEYIRNKMKPKGNLLDFIRSRRKK